MEPGSSIKVTNCVLTLSIEEFVKNIDPKVPNSLSDDDIIYYYVGILGSEGPIGATGESGQKGQNGTNSQNGDSGGDSSDRWKKYC